MKKVGIVGLGYVGLPLALLTKKRGYDVIGIDNDEEKISCINNRQSPFYDSEISRDLKKYPITASNLYSDLAEAKIIIICVPTPVDDEHMPDLTIVISTCLAVATILKKGQLVIVESTINPGVCDDVIIPLIESKSGLKCNEDFYVAHCPERINPGDENWGVHNIPRVVGSSSEKGLELAYSFYSSILDANIHKMGSLKEVEAVKVVENSFRDVNIAFANELAMSFDTLGIDVVNVINGAATKPFGFMPHYPGVGVGGHCIPVDPYYLIEYAKSNGFTHKFLSIAREINNSMPSYVIGSMTKLLSQQKINLKKLRVTVLGLSYKPNVGDLRESPSLEVLSLLQKQGIKVLASDPYINEVNDFETHSATTRQEIVTLLKQTDLVIIATAHNIYLDFTAQDFEKAGVKFVIDGRNCLDHKAFKTSKVIYRGVGRL